MLLLHQNPISKHFWLNQRKAIKKIIPPPLHPPLQIEMRRGTVYRPYARAEGKNTDPKWKIQLAIYHTLETLPSTFFYWLLHRRRNIGSFSEVRQSFETWAEQKRRKLGLDWRGGTEAKKGLFPSTKIRENHFWNQKMIIWARERERKRECGDAHMMSTRNWVVQCNAKKSGQILVNMKGH